MTTKARKSLEQLSDESLSFLHELTGGSLTFGQVLASIRKCDELTQEQLATRLKITRHHLSDIENGRRHVSPTRAAAFAKKLGYSEKRFIQLAVQDLLAKEGFDYDVVLQDKGA